MAKVTLDKIAFKALASETRLDILRTLDGKKMGLKDISSATNLNKATLHEHLTKLHEAGLVKRKEREGHKWVYYKLSWKGASLLHPENTRIVVLFSATLISLFFGVIGIINFARDKFLAAESSDMMFKAGPEPVEDTLNQAGREALGIGQNQIFMYIAIVCLILFTVLMVISIWRYRENKTQKL